MPDECKKLYPEGTEIPEIIYEPMYVGGIFMKDMISFDIYELMPSYDGNVLLFMGTVAPSMGAEAPQLIEQAVQAFPSAKAVAIEGANHSFSGDARTQMVEQTKAFILENIN